MKKEHIPYFDIGAPYDIVYRQCISPYPVLPHTHNAAELYLTCTYLPDVLLDDTVSQVPTWSLIVIPPFCVHQLFHETNIMYERYILSIHHEWLDKILFHVKEPFPYLRPGAKPVIVSLQPDRQTQITDAFQKVLGQKCGTSLSDVSNLFSLLDQIDTIITTESSSILTKERNISPAQQHVNLIISYINEHSNETIRIKDLADYFYLNPDYLSRLFKQHTHTSVGHYITLQKITLSQALFRQGYSVTQVQEKIGFSSYSHFAKTFKKITGITPGQYIKTICYR